MQAGYVPEANAIEIAPLLDSGHRHAAYIKKVLEGGQAPIPVIVADLYPPTADPLSGVLEQEVPPKP
jgi:hypothetical protein